MTEVLRPYQVEAIAKFWRTVEAGQRRIIMVAPTASGKTVIARAIIEQARSKASGSLFLAHRREILTQTSNKLRGIPHGVIRPGEAPRPFELVQVASVQTLNRRAIKAGTMELPEAGLVIVDEAHHCPARSYRSIIEQYPNAVLLGLTATPCRGDGRGLGSVFQTMIQCPQVGELVERGFLVPTRVYAPVDPDLHGVRTRHGDYAEAELADRMDRPKLVGDIVTNWIKFGERRKTICFATNVRHSVHIRDEFVASGVRAEHIDGSTPMDERDATLARLASGEIEVVTNCMVLTEGWDMPTLGCLILARPTKQMGLYRQMIGRGMRPASNKVDCIVIDHSGATYRLGFAEDFIEWTLDPDLHAQNPAHIARDGDHPGGPKIVECPECGVARVGGMACLNCGYLPAPSPRAVEVIDGDLGLVGASRRAQPNPDDLRTREEWHGMLAGIAAERSYKPGWVAHQYRTRFGEWPPCGAEPLVREPSVEVRRWVKSRMIAYARAEAGMKQRAAERFVRLTQAMIESQAWRSLNGNARAVYVELANLYRGNNNGRIGFSARQAARVMPVSIATAARALVQLQDRGFIIAESKGHFDRKRHATRWRLTEFGCDVTGQPASRDFETWVPDGREGEKGG